jgi:protein arginine kinase
MTQRQRKSSALSPDPLPVWCSGSGPEADLVISTRVRLARNLARYRFPHFADKNERREIYNRISSILENQKEFHAFSVINCTSLQEIDQLLLLEERLISPDLLKMEGDRGVAIENTRHTSIMINEEDHLRMNSIESGFNAEDVWYRINLIDDLLGHYLPFAYEARRGFLTSCPTNSGTGLRVSFLLHLPGLVLTKTIDSVLMAASQMGISTRGFFGEHSEVIGHLFQLSNQATLGACEEDFLRHTRSTIAEVIKHERIARERILEEASLELSDKTHRAWGILLHAKMVTTSEFLNLASALRVGIDCQLFSDLTIEQLNRLTLAIMPAHLQKLYGKALSDDELHSLRAETIRQFLSTLKPKKRTPATKRSKKQPENKNKKE